MPPALAGGVFTYRHKSIVKLEPNFGIIQNIFLAGGFFCKKQKSKVNIVKFSGHSTPANPGPAPLQRATNRNPNSEIFLYPYFVKQPWPCQAKF